jgi:alkaline phosphatase D
MIRFILLAIVVCSYSKANSQTSISPLDCVNHFYHGVASGDPLTDAVIIWTRITPDDFTAPVIVNYKVALDTGMVNAVTQGSTLTDASKDYTVKIDVTGLQPDVYYYYEFSGLGSKSVRGRTKTAPSGAVNDLRFAVVSCANLEAGYFNVYKAINERNDFEAVLMLGDYIYEYEEGGYGQNTSIDRVFDPTYETITMADYRLRYSVYHMDQSLQQLHQNFPWICVWDDHESANDSYKDGAQNHNVGEGLWSDRKLDAQKAYFEWLPIRPKSANNYEIFRKFQYGELLDLFMVDTRLNGREEQGINVNDPNRTMLGVNQYQWLTDELAASTSQWKVLGNQVIMAPVTIFGTPINDDAWDGYPAERENVLNFVQDNNIENFTVITGDVHTSWAFDLELTSNHVGVEFVTPSVTSPGIPINVGGILMLENPHIKFVELTQHGFIMLDLNQQRVQADWFFINTITQNNNSAYTWVKSLYSNNGSMQLLETTSVALPSAKYDVDHAPICPRIETPSSAGIQVNQTIDLLGIYPNPAIDKINIHYQSIESGIHHVEILDLNGNVLISNDKVTNVNNSTIAIVDVSQMPSGIYFIRIVSSTGNSVRTRFMKN